MAEAARQDRSLDESYQLADRYRRRAGRVYLTGVQALVRLPLMQRQRDAAAGLHTAGFVSGYRGSPLGTYDQALWQAQPELAAHDVRFEPGVNEDLAATAVWGSQQAGLYEGARHDGVFGIWYGKGPGVDRSCDALKHANYAGTAPRGGVLALCGDDPAARSSSIAHQSEHALVHCGIPLLHPADVQEYLDLGLLGFALSRWSGCWVGMKCVTDTVDSARSVAVDPARTSIVEPLDFERPENLHIGWTNIPLAVERRLYQQRIPAAHAFVRANAFDRVVWPCERRRLGIVTTGKAYHDVMQALASLGVDRERAAELGLEIYKVALVWPLEPQGARRFAAGLEDLLVVEEKRPFLEEQLASVLFNEPGRPRLLGKHDEHGAPLLPSEGELAPAAVAAALRAWLERRAPELARGLAPLPPVPEALAGAGGPLRLPAFCAGCPHNTSTNVPEESLALGGIGCHGMAVWLPERRTLAVTQMGGEGANWIGAAPFTDTAHVFQNLGDGTYFHSGLLAIRAAVTAGVNVTYKVLANGAVAMTGGQPIEGESLAGEVTVPEIVRQLAAEGVGRIEVVSDDATKYARGAFAKGVGVHPRAQLERVQRELRETPGVTALVYDQTCAAEARRLRKRGELPEPDRRVVINELVCEGCGDCSVVSNCIAIEPLETEFGRKRRIDQSGCNKDYSCVAGYCPSFASVTGGRLRRAAGGADAGDEDPASGLPEPVPADAARPWNVLVAGIGGGGVVTAGALLGMAAHLEGRGCSVLDVTGLAQKNGPVTAHVCIANDPEALHATRIGAGSADLVVACDPIVGSAAEALGAIGKGRSRVLVNTHVAPTFEFAHAPDLDLSPDRMLARLRGAAGDHAVEALAATELATALLGDAVFANLFLLGFALQRGRLPVSRAALERAIELNGRAVEANRRALAWGRLAAVDLAAVEKTARPGLRTPPATTAGTLEELVARRVAFLVGYQSRRYARRYERLVARVAERERALPGASATSAERPPLASAVAHAYFKLLAYKDEYEVARLWTDGSFRAQLEREFEGDYRVQLHLAPQLLNRRDPATGRAAKWTLGPWAFRGLRLLAHARRLRGTPLDPFGWTAHRRRERQLIRDYEATVEELLRDLAPEKHALAVEIAELPERIRGYDTIKEASMLETRARERELLAAYRGGTS